MADHEMSPQPDMPNTVPPAFGTSYLRSIRPQITTAAVQNHLPPTLLAGLAMTESSGDPYAISCDAGWARRHWRGILRALHLSPSRRDDSWAAQPFWFDLGIGLCQVHLIVAIEHGVPLRTPAQLFEPATNLTAAARALAAHIRRHRGNERLALLAYNGRSDLAYPNRVARNIELVLRSGW